MSFTYSAIGDNTPENREHCKVLGLVKHPFSHERGDMIATYTDTKSNISFYLISWKDTDMLKPDIVHCIGNTALFQAITAMRDDSDYMQWFVDPIGNWHFNPILMDGMRKATLDELINHFNSK